MASTPPSVIAEAVGSIRILTLNRPEKLNAADLEMQQRLLRHLEEVAADADARALILTGAGRAFSAAASTRGAAAWLWASSKFTVIE